MRWEQRRLGHHQPNTQHEKQNGCLEMQQTHHHLCPKCVQEAGDASDMHIVLHQGAEAAESITRDTGTQRRGGCEHL